MHAVYENCVAWALSPLYSNRLSTPARWLPVLFVGALIWSILGDGGRAKKRDSARDSECRLDESVRGATRAMEQATDLKLPTPVTVLGWGWIILGILSFISGTMALLMSTVMNAMAPGGFPPSGKNFPPQFAVMQVVFEHFTILALTQLVLAACVVYTGANLLKLREWARRVLLALSILALTYIVSFSIFWMYMWISMTHTGAAAAPGPPMAFTLLGVVGGTMNMVVFSIPAILSINSLRGKSVRDAIANRHRYVRDPQ